MQFIDQASQKSGAAGTSRKSALRLAAGVAFAGVLLGAGTASFGALEASFELVPTSVPAGGQIVGNSVVLSSASGVVQYNIVEVIHGTNATSTDDGLQQAPGGLVATSSGLSGAFALPTLASNYNNGFSQVGTLVTVGQNTNVGSETTFGASIGANGGNDFIPVSNNATGTPPFTFGTGTTTGDTAFVVGTTSFTIGAGTTGSVALNYVPDFTSTGTATTKQNQKFEVDGTAFAVQGNGSTTNGSITGALDAPTSTITVSATPEPGSIALFSLGALGVLARRRRQMK
jgi:hypothetical protein